MKFVFRTIEGAEITECTEKQAHDLLREYAADHSLEAHIHIGGWEGMAMSAAFEPDGDKLLTMHAVVLPQR